MFKMFKMMKVLLVALCVVYLPGAFSTPVEYEEKGNAKE